MKKLVKILGGTLCFALLLNSVKAFSATVPATQSVILEWSPSPDTNVVGCNIYYGGASGDYTNMVNAGYVTNATISGLVAGVTYYFAATAYDAFGQESAYSTEISYLVPPPPPSMQIRSAPGGQFLLTVSGLAGHIFEIQATQDFVTWTTVGTMTLDTGGSADFTDTNAGNFQQRFYRAQETPEIAAPIQ